MEFIWTIKCYLIKRSLASKSLNHLRWYRAKWWLGTKSCLKWGTQEEAFTLHRHLGSCNRIEKALNSVDRALKKWKNSKVWNRRNNRQRMTSCGGTTRVPCLQGNMRQSRHPYASTSTLRSAISNPIRKFQPRKESPSRFTEGSLWVKPSNCARLLKHWVKEWLEIRLSNCRSNPQAVQALPNFTSVPRTTPWINPGSSRWKKVCRSINDSLDHASMQMCLC